MTATIHEALQVQDSLPVVHIVDRSYVDAGLLVSSQEDYGIDLLGPTRDDTSWRARQKAGFASQDFTIDRENKQAICPAGQRSLHWLPTIQNKFSKKVCRVCELQSQCTRAKPPRRTITVRPEAHHKALLAAREREQTEAFSQQYARRAGIEGTISQAVRTCGLRQARYTGLAKTHLQHLFTAMAINMVCAIRWLTGH